MPRALPHRVGAGPTHRDNGFSASFPKCLAVVGAVMPGEAGIQGLVGARVSWTPAQAGATRGELFPRATYGTAHHSVIGILCLDQDKRLKSLLQRPLPRYPRAEQLLQTIPDQVDGQGGSQDQSAREDGNPPVPRQYSSLSIVQHVTPAGLG